MRSERQFHISLFILSALLGGCGGSTRLPKPEPSPARFLPSAQELSAGWRASDSPRLYRGRELFDYLDGGADLYLEYGFREVAAREYRSPGDIPVTVGLYRMADPAAAFGIFSATRRPDYQPVALGAAGARTDYVQIFYQGAYFIEVQALAWNDKAASELDEICRVLAGKLPRPTDTLPEVVDLLPRENLLPQSLVFVRGPLGFNSRHYLSDENILALSSRTPGVLGLVRGSGPDTAASLVLAVQYPDSAAASRVLAGLLAFYRERSEKERCAAQAGTDSCFFSGPWGQAELVRRDLRLYAAFRPAD